MGVDAFWRLEGTRFNITIQIPMCWKKGKIGLNHCYTANILKELMRFRIVLIVLIGDNSWRFTTLSLKTTFFSFIVLIVLVLMTR